METYYLIDYENVYSDGLSGCENLSSKDHIVIFFTKNAKRIDMSEIANLGDVGLEMIEVSAGKQSADMHIASWLGYLVGINQDKNYRIAIVSKDTDYDKIIEFWGKRKVKISRVKQIKAFKHKSNAITQGKRTVKVSDKKSRLNQEIMQSVRNAGYVASVANAVAQIVTGFYGEERIMVKVHNALREKYTDYLDIYEVIKPVVDKCDKDVTGRKKVVSISSKDRTAMNTEIMRLLSRAGYANDIITHVASVVVKNLGVQNGKQKIYRTVVSKFGQKKGLEIYNRIRNHL